MSERIRRARELLSAENVDALVVASPVNRRYLTGFTGTAGTVVITGDTAHLLTDFRYVEQAKKEAPAFTLVEYEEPLEELASVLETVGAGSAAYESAHVSVKAQREREEKISGVSWAPADGWIESLRSVKEPGELEILEQAVSLADRAFTYIAERLPGRTEREVALDLEFFMRREGADGLAFPTIVASGLQGAFPHAVPGDRIIGPGDFVTLDFGAVMNGYCSDMTRTVIVGAPDGKQKEVYELVLLALETGIRAVRPGRLGKDVDAEARQVIDDAGYGERFGHGLGHGVGLEVHEDPPRLSKRSEAKIEPGMITSVEPGIYIPEWGGVRIEDLVVVTEEGCRVLTGSARQLVQV